MDKHGWIALGLGTFFSRLIGCGLMALMFCSSRSGHDEAADSFRKGESRPLSNAPVLAAPSILASVGAVANVSSQVLSQAFEERVPYRPPKLAGIHVARARPMKPRFTPVPSTAGSKRWAMSRGRF